MDERYVCVDVVGKGLVIFSALAENVDIISTFNLTSFTMYHRCSHAGIVNVVKDAVAKFSRPIHMVRLSIRRNVIDRTKAAALIHINRSLGACISQVPN